MEKINDKVIEKIPTFCLIHSKEINHPLGSSLNKRLINSFKKTKFIIANSNFTKKLGIKIGLPKKKYIIHPGCEEPVKIEKEYELEAEKIYQRLFSKNYYCCKT